MALLDSRGVFRRCPECDTAVADDATICGACGATLEAASRRIGGKKGPGGKEPKKIANPVFGTANPLGLIAGNSFTGGAADVLGDAFSKIGNAAGELAVKLLGYEVGEKALDDNPYRGEALGLGALFRRQLYRLLFPFRTGLREANLIKLYRDMAKYADSGIGFHDALARLEKTQKSPVLARMLAEIRRDLHEGATLHEAFARHSYLLEPIHLALIEVGESLGTVGDSMRQLVELIEERRELRRQILRKMFFPCAAIAIATYLFPIALLVFGNPLMYLRAVLPPTFVFATMAFAWWVFLPMMLAAAGRGITDHVKLVIPAFGTIARANALARFARALSAAIAAGVEIDKSLRMAALAADNHVVETAVRNAIPLVKERGLAEGLEAGGVLPDDVAGDVEHGERTGTLSETLLQVSKDAHERAARGTAVMAAAFGFGLTFLAVLYSVYTVFTKMFMIGSGVRPNLSVPDVKVPSPFDAFPKRR